MDFHFRAVMVKCRINCAAGGVQYMPSVIDRRITRKPQ